jgi:hypothetical protein
MATAGMMAVAVVIGPGATMSPAATISAAAGITADMTRSQAACLERCVLDIAHLREKAVAVMMAMMEQGGRGCRLCGQLRHSVG